MPGNKNGVELLLLLLLLSGTADQLRTGCRGSRGGDERERRNRGEEQKEEEDEEEEAGSFIPPRPLSLWFSTPLRIHQSPYA